MFEKHLSSIHPCVPNIQQDGLLLIEFRKTISWKLFNDMIKCLLWTTQLISFLVNFMYSLTVFKKKWMKEIICSYSVQFDISESSLVSWALIEYWTQNVDCGLRWMGRTFSNWFTNWGFFTFFFLQNVCEFLSNFFYRL